MSCKPGQMAEVPIKLCWWSLHRQHTSQIWFFSNSFAVASFLTVAGECNDSDLFNFIKHLDLLFTVPWDAVKTFVGSRIPSVYHGVWTEPQMSKGGCCGLLSRQVPMHFMGVFKGSLTCCRIKGHDCLFPHRCFTKLNFWSIKGDLLNL